MKRFFTILCTAMLGTGAFAQLVPNGDFENGTASWQGLNTNLVGSVTVTTSQGTQTLTPVSGTKMAFMQSTTSTAFIAQKFAYNQRPKSFRYMYCYLPAGAGEIGAAFVRLTKFNSSTSKVDTLLSVIISMSAASYPWKEAIIELSDKYKAAGNPDTAYVAFFNSASTVHLQGTALILDNVKFSANSASVKEIDNSLVGQPFATPNPAVDQAAIHFQTNTLSDVKVELYDMSGKMVKSILNEKLNYGNHTAEFSTADLTPGVYFYKVSTGSYTTSEKLFITR